MAKARFGGSFEDFKNKLRVLLHVNHRVADSAREWGISGVSVAAQWRSSGVPLARVWR